MTIGGKLNRTISVVLASAVAAALAVSPTLVASADSGGSQTPRASANAVKPATVNVRVSGLPSGTGATVTFSGPKTVTAAVVGAKAVKLTTPGTYRWTASDVLKDGVTYRASTASGSFKAVSGKSRNLSIVYAALAYPPAAPTNVTATAGEGTATVTWAAPESDGGSAITGYTVTSSPGGKTCTSLSTTCSVSGLTNGTSYTFSVVARNGAGSSPSSGASNAVTPNYVFTPLNSPTLAPDGMTVTVNSITRVEDVGSVRLTINYTLANNTTDKELDEKGFKLFFSDGTATPQYGFFNSLFPGQSRTGSYTWEFLKGKIPTVVEYGSDFFAKDPAPGLPKWQA